MKKRPLITTCLLLLNILLSFTSIVNAEQTTTKKTPVKQERRTFSSPILQDVYDHGYPGERGYGDSINVTEIVEKYIPIGTSFDDTKSILDKNGLSMLKTLDVVPAGVEGLTDRDYRVKYLFEGANLFSGKWSTIYMIIGLHFSDQNKLIRMRATTFYDGM